MNKQNTYQSPYPPTQVNKQKKLSKDEILERISGLKVVTTFVSVIGFGVLTSIVAMHVVGVTSKANSTQTSSTTSSQPTSSSPSSQPTPQQPASNGGFNFGSGFNNPAPVSGSGGS